MSVMVLLVALDHWKVEREEVVPPQTSRSMSGSIGNLAGGSPLQSSEVAPKKDENAFRYFISKLVSCPAPLGIDCIVLTLADT